MTTLSRTTRSLLIWIGRVTKTDISYLATNSAWLLLANVVSALLAFGVTVAFAHFASKEDFGTYRYLLTIVWTLSAFSLTGIPTILTRAVARGEVHTYRTAFVLSLLGSIPVALISLCMSVYYGLQENELLQGGMLIIACLAPFLPIAYLYGPYFEGKKDFFRNALFGIALSFVPAIALVGTMFFFPHPLLYLSAYLGGTLLVGGVISLVLYLRHHSPPKQQAREFGKLAGHFSLMSLLGTIATQLDKLLVFHFLGPVQLALYTFATAIPDHVKIFFNNVGNLALPKFAHRTLEEIQKNIWGRLMGFTLIIGLIVLAYILAAPYIFALFFPQYNDAIVYSQLFALSLIPSSSMIPLAILEAHVAKKQLYIFNGVFPVVQMVALVILTPLFGIMGAIGARIIARIFNLLFASILTWWLFSTNKDAIRAE